LRINGLQTMCEPHLFAGNLFQSYVTEKMVGGNGLEPLTLSV